MQNAEPMNENALFFKNYIEKMRKNESLSQGSNIINIPHSLKRRESLFVNNAVIRENKSDDEKSSKCKIIRDEFYLNLKQLMDEEPVPNSLYF